MNAASSTTIAAAIKHCKTPKQLLQLHSHTINNPSLLQISSSPCLHLAPAPTLLRLCNRLPQLCRRSLFNRIHPSTFSFNKWNQSTGSLESSSIKGAWLAWRAGLIKEAMVMIVKMPMGGVVFGWDGLLGGCRIHGHVETAKKAAEQVTELDREDEECVQSWPISMQLQKNGTML